LRFIVCILNYCSTTQFGIVNKHPKRDTVMLSTKNKVAYPPPLLLSSTVKPAMIKNCWQHTKILPETTSEMDIEIDEDIANLISTLNCLKLADPSVDMTAEEYVELDSDLISANLPTKEEILEEFLVDEGVLQQMQVHIKEDSSEEEEEIISMKVGRQALETVKKFLEQREFTTEEDIRYVRDIIRRLDESVEKSKRQTLLTEYITQ